jgi:tRNA threonylcarbamoyladenosine biosynthesis protein TsaE
MRNVTLIKDKHRKQFKIPSEKDWGELAEQVAAGLEPGHIVAVSGPLGAGKTTFVQALAKALGIKKNIQSPTFALMRSYPIPKRDELKRLLHVDAYRIEDERDLLPLDLDQELADGQTALVLEWPEKIKNWIDRKPSIQINIA